jgi:bifunctional NMN adenylyltransferase/nudix hydrolase
MKYNYLIYIGRFQPFHNGHKYIIEEGLKISNNIIIFCGSSNQTRTLKNPFTYTERRKCILNSFSKLYRNKIHIKSLDDCENDIEWIKRVEKIVENTPENRVALIGHTKDNSCYYLKLFEKWKYFEIKNFADIDATYIRNVIFNTNDKYQIENTIKKLVPPEVLKFILDFLDTKLYLDLKDLYTSQNA